jgi:hypothetical protein
MAKTWKTRRFFDQRTRRVRIRRQRASRKARVRYRKLLEVAENVRKSRESSA